MHWILDRISEMMVILFQATAEAQLANLNLLDLPVLRSHFQLYALRNEEMELILEIISEMTEIQPMGMADPQLAILKLGFDEIEKAAMIYEEMASEVVDLRIAMTEMLSGVMDETNIEPLWLDLRVLLLIQLLAQSFEMDLIFTSGLVKMETQLLAMDAIVELWNSLINVMKVTL